MTSKNAMGALSSLKKLKKVVAPIALVSSAVALSAPSYAADTEKLKVFVSFGFYGNTWMEQNKNMMEALTKSSDYSDKVDIEFQVVNNGDAQRQAQQINGMVEAGADLIVMYPSSPTALNRSIRNACRQGISVIAWDSTVSERCATNVHADNKVLATNQAEWAVKAIKESGNILMINGAPGVAANDDRVVAAKKVYDKYPNVNVVAEVNGMWSDPVVLGELSKVMAVKKWSDIDIATAQLGCYPFYQLQDSAGIPDAEKIPCAGSAEISERVALMDPNTDVGETEGAFRPMGIKGQTFEVGPVMGAQALMYGIDALLEGKELPHDIIMDVPVVTYEDTKLCETGSWQEMHETGCNVFKPSMIPNTEFSVAIYSEDTPQLGLQAALNGTPEY